MIEMKLMIMDALRSGSSWAGKAVRTDRTTIQVIFLLVDLLKGIMLFVHITGVA